MMTKSIHRILLAGLILIVGLAGGSQTVTAQPSGWSQPHYLNVSGTLFRPRSSISTWNHLSNCLVVTSNAQKVFNVPIQLPQGARVDYLSFTYVDTSEEFGFNSNAFLAIYDGHGGITDLAALISEDTYTNGITTSPFIGHIVDNATYSYVLSYKAVEAGASLRLCGMKLTYRVPAENVFLPLLAK